MGGIKDSTYLDVKKTLARRFSSRDGWQCASSPAGSVQPECVLSRRVAGRTERVLVNVNMAPVVQAGAVEALQAAASAGSVDKAVLVVPGGADVSRVPAGIDVIELGTWQVVSGRIAWSKNIERSAFLEEERVKRGLA
ncbi:MULTISPECIES: hypothetical protein [unclassified Methanoculleus]|uniref:hypothetical protein n=1 Tax=unclassified Methanoculleus TaxID=2619537 RepID=UPI0025F45A7A|nr:MULTISPECIES: hypothetical protein [unclassified Methanoculleus]MCK9316956.1 hypothetical protein [Methanoculleus sp.]MDD2252832.1 hypothetical protein [Methanoculleus sp.]MDD2787203.1 hypothetical protein [Methanoculleus sp.]MDD3215751.1 hypothetical protein [Methanoculleus sp.]MDD4313490.1 hypothetical protein [Methanoculleus sp.]